MKKIIPFLWFDDNAEEAARFYVSVFKKSKIIGKTFYPDGGPKPHGTVATVMFELDGDKFIALNGGPQFKFTEAISLTVYCKTQQEIDQLSKKLTAGGGQEIACGWLKDKYGLFWQIMPDFLEKFLTSKDRTRSERVMQAVWRMKRVDIKKLKEAYAGK